MGFLVSFRFFEVYIRTCIVVVCGRCVSSQALAAQKRRTNGISISLEHGETGLSVAFDYPTLYGYDTDHPLARGEFGKCGVAISSLVIWSYYFMGFLVR